jgi:hypothetical protein
MRARQALVLAVFLEGDYVAALEYETVNLEAFRKTGSLFQVADSMTLLSAVHFRLGAPVTSWERMAEGLRFFTTNDNASGLARGLAMAAILQIQDGDPEFGARIAGAVYELIREKGVMLAPVKVLHLPDPGDLAREHFGPERAEELMAIGAALPLAQAIAEVLAASPPTGAQPPAGR